MTVIYPEFEAECQAALDKFFAAYPEATLQEQANKALRLLRASDEPLKGKVEGWAAGIIYEVGTFGRQPVGVPHVMNADFEKAMGVTMGTARYRAARVREIISRL